MGTLHKRSAKAKMTTAKLLVLHTSLGKVRFKTRHFWGTNIAPTLSFGTAAFGMGHVRLRAGRSRVAITVQRHFGQCPHSTIAIGLPLGSDPELHNVRQAISFWTNGFMDSQLDWEAQFCSVWQKIHGRLSVLPASSLWCRKVL